MLIQSQDTADLKALRNRNHCRIRKPKVKVAVSPDQLSTSDQVIHAECFEYKSAL